MMQTFTRLSTAVVLAGAMASLTPAPVSAQGIFGRMKDKAAEAAKRKVEERTERRAGEATDAALDKAECRVPGTKCDDSEKSESNGATATAATSSKSAKLKPGEGAWKNYDFVPGDRVIFAEDFSDVDVGDFPKRFTFKSGNIETVEWNGARYLSTNTFGSEFSIPLPETLPERFTLEFDYSAAGGNGMTIYFVDPVKGYEKTHVDMGTWSGGLDGGGIKAIGHPADEYGYKDAVFPVRIMVDGKHAKVYMGETRVANVPNADLGRADRIWFSLPGREERAAMIGNVRIAAGGKKLYDALSANGRVSTQGILFDVGSDRIRPESTPTLKEITAMLKEHADLKLRIEGHTDNVGDDDANQTLSEQRAAAVQAYLVSQGIAAGRLKSQGLGATKPVASNDKAEGRQQNRRVELVRM